MTTTPAQRLIIGVDFGTTYTCVSFVRTEVTKWSTAVPLKSFKNEIMTVRDWPHPSVGELQTALLYDDTADNSPYYGNDAETAWQYGVESSSQVIRLFKLALHESRETHDERLELQRIANDLGKEAVDFITDFLQKIRIFLLDGPQCYFRRHYVANWLDQVKVEWVLGIPAAWQNPNEQQMYVEAARRAGIRSPSLVSEPEATATLFFAIDDGSFEIGDSFVICDAGGGTVDVITYTVVNVEPLQVVEASVGEGVLCGSIYLDKRFRRFFEMKLRDYGYSGEVLEMAVNEGTERFTAVIKNKFDATGNDNSPVSIKIRDGLVNKHATICTRGELRREVFDPVFSQICDLVEDQLQSSQAAADRACLNPQDRRPLRYKSIILAGGMSRNRYLFHFLSSRFDNDAAPRGKIQIREPMPFVETAVAQGCALMAVDQTGLIKQRKSQFSYGVTTWIEYEQEAHGPKKKARPVLDPQENFLKLPVVQWFVNKNEPITKEILKEDRDRYRTAAPGDDFIFIDEIIVSRLDTWSQEDTVMTGNKELEKSIVNRHIITSDLSQISKESFEQCHTRDSGKPYWKVTYQIGLELENYDMTFYVLVKTADGREIRTECKCDFASTESIFTSVGTIASRWRDKRAASTGEAISRPAKRPQHPNTQPGPIRKSPRTPKPRTEFNWSRSGYLRANLDLISARSPMEQNERHNTRSGQSAVATPPSKSNGNTNNRVFDENWGFGARSSLEDEEFFMSDAGTED